MRTTSDVFTLISGFNPTPVEMKLSKCLCWVMGPHQDNTKEMRKEQEGGDMSHPDYRETVQNI